MSWAPPRLYAILDDDLTREAGIDPGELLDCWLDAGIRLIQVRAKHRSFGPALALAEPLARRAAKADATLIVNDRADVARMVGAAGVHVGQTDLAPRAVRAVVGAGMLVGLSTHTEAQWQAACAEPVDYIAVGPVFETTTKANPDRVIGLPGVTQAAGAARAAGLPLVAIGGITAANAADVIAAGASSVAIAGDLVRGNWKTLPGSILACL